MAELESRFLDAFPGWLKQLGDDARALVALIGTPDLPDAARRRVAGALNYLFKSLDLIPDGIEDLGFIDDAFVLRVAADGEGADADSTGTLPRLSGEAELVREFLGDDYSRLESYVAGLDKTSARGRSVDEILGDETVRSEFVREVKVWADGYAPPSFARDPKNLVKLRSFLTAKLPA